MPSNPRLAVVAPIVIAPIWLPEITLAVLLPRIPIVGHDSTPVAGWTAIVDEPSRLPIVLLAKLNRHADWKFTPIASIATNPAAPETLPAKPVVWSIPE